MTNEGAREFSEDLDATLDAAAHALRGADALLIGAGAGMSVDSGLPDFRGDEGFWNAYPSFRGRRFAELSNPYWFRADPEQAWGFFGHRLNLYSAHEPHAGFQILRSWEQRFTHGVFIFTSNVDGHFQRAGFTEEQVLECHGSIHFLQCVRCCGDEIWPVQDLCMSVDPATIRATSKLPTCPHCRGLARPNILMFGDSDWLSGRAEQQELRYRAWLSRTRESKRVALELGAGLAVPTVRMQCERRGAPLIRVNPSEATTRPDQLSLPMEALQAIQALDARLQAA
jgi:NAD-dependent SIR2 family protein deacetylase